MKIIDRLLRRPCGALPPERLADAETCCIRRAHGDWHADGNGYIWNDTLGQWRWMGPVIDLSDEHA